jgi:ribosomal protein S18 acetylase RimI-like enzyme
MPDPFRPPAGTRFPLPSDRFAVFEAAGILRGLLSFVEILDYHRPDQGQFTLLRIHDGTLAGAVCFALREQDVSIDFLTREGRFNVRGVPVGTWLLRAVEEFAAAAGREAIALEAMDDAALIAWYLHEGFEREGRAFADARWGELFPMVKRVGPGRADGP